MSFRIGSIPVRIHAAFFFVALLLGANVSDPASIAIWVAVVFVSVLVHELGHALMGRAFHLTPRIDLHGMGGTTSWVGPPAEIGNGKRMAISLAGPFAGFAFGALVLLATLRMPPLHPLAAHAVRSLLWVNVGWGVFNLLPMMPLDGGNVMRAAFDAATKGRGEKPARILSLAACLALVVLAYLRQNWWIGALAVLFAMTNVRALQDAKTRRADQALVAAIQNAHRALEGKHAAEAIALLQPALVPEASEDIRAAGVQLLGYALLLDERWDDLVVLVENERALVARDDLDRFAQKARELGREQEAERIDAVGKALDAAPSLNA